MAEAEKPLSKGDVVRAAMIEVVQHQMKTRDTVRAVRTQKAFELLHIKGDEIADELYLSMLYDHIKGSV